LHFHVDGAENLVDHLRALGVVVVGQVSARARVVVLEAALSTLGDYRGSVALREKAHRGCGEWPTEWR